jgi:putative zinc finger protein
MPGETKHGIECSQFEALLSDALDGQLSGSRKESFEAHGRICAICGPLLADALVGQQLLKSLEEVEPPAYLINSILASTSGISSARLRAESQAGSKTGVGQRVRQWWDSFITPTAAFVRQPRFVMSFGMIFFSFSLALSAAGVKPSDVASINLRPSAIKRTYYTTQGKVVKFYENIRFVYEIESRVREFKKSTTPAEPGPAKPTQNRKNNNDTSGQPDQKQERNYSRDENQPVLAGLPELPPDVTVTTNRRFV